MEADLVPRAGMTFEAVPAAGLHGVGLRALPRNAAALVRGIGGAAGVIRRFRPEAMLLTGGYVGVPAALAGRGVPKVLYVPDIEPALAARLIARLADVIAVTAEDSSFYCRQARRRHRIPDPARSGAGGEVRCPGPAWPFARGPRDRRAGRQPRGAVDQ
jgi:UDP-N-acetylglucosamine--N-acetylmuramyl-(pentapeptide) pyrophosphoryl-undecaprenol N-acetylglucosamine transferase